LKKLTVMGLSPSDNDPIGNGYKGISLTVILDGSDPLANLTEGHLVAEGLR
jgi:hypothetical protein